MTVLAPHWRHSRESLPSALERLLALVDGVRGDRLVTADWTIADTLAHLATITAMDVALARQTAPTLPVPALGELIRATTVDTVADMNDKVMAGFTERRLPQLAARLREDVNALLAATLDADPAREVDWLGGSRVPLDGLIAHLLNELNVHAWDIARALGRPWRTDPRDAVQFVDVFIAGVTRSGYGRLLDRDGPVRKGRIAVTFRSRGGAPLTLALTDGLITVAPPEQRPDVRLSYDPAAFNLMLFGRIGRVHAALSGKVAVTGRRPWLLPAFMRVLRLPS